MSTNELTPERLIETYQYTSATDHTILKGMNSVDWEQLQHAHGSSYDIPALLRASISPIRDHRDFAFILLHETIWHQGTIYQASSYVVPFLYAIMQSEDVPDSDNAAFLLASLANGHSEDPRIIDKTRKAIELYLHALLPYIHHHEPSFRTNVARALSHYPQYKTLIISKLAAQLAQEDDKYTAQDLQEAINTLQEQ